MDSVADYICWKKVSKLDRAVEFKQKGKNEELDYEICGTKSSRLYVIGVPEEERIKAESILKKKKKMAGNFLNRGKKQAIHVQEAQRV